MLRWAPWVALLCGSCDRGDEPSRATLASAAPVRASSAARAASAVIPKPASSTVPAPAASAAPNTPVPERCATGFRSLRSANADVHRLGLACGPSRGMKRLRARPSRAEPVQWVEQLETGQCLRVMAVAERPDTVLTASLASGDELAESRRRGWLLGPVESDRCAPQPLTVRVRVSGTGPFAAELWKRN